MEERFSGFEVLFHFFFCQFHFFSQFPGGHPQHAAAQRTQLDQRVGGGYPDGVVFADLVHKGFNIGVGGLPFFGVDQLDVVKFFFFTGVALDFLAVKHQYQPAFFKAGIAGEGIA